MSDLPSCLQSHPVGSIDYYKCSQAKMSVCGNKRIVAIKIKLDDLNEKIRLEEERERERLKVLDELNEKIRLEEEKYKEEKRKDLDELNSIKVKIETKINEVPVENVNDIKSEIKKKVKQINTIKKEAVFTRLSSGKSSKASKK